MPATLSKPVGSWIEELDDVPSLPVGAEFVDGRILEKPVSELSCWISNQVYRRLDDYDQDHE
jgi:hypothetical protein